MLSVLNQRLLAIAVIVQPAHGMCVMIYDPYASKQKTAIVVLENNQPQRVVFHYES
jgi:hypothetical protein